MVGTQSKFKVHYSPVKGGADYSLVKINAKNFNFKKHFEKSLLAKSELWWVVEKTKPWAVLDCMIIDSGEQIRSSFSQFSPNEISVLFQLADMIAEIEKKEGAHKIIVGANINHELDNDHLDKVLLRLHMHVVGFTPEELKEMRELSIEELEEEDSNIFESLYDPLLKDFQQKFLALYPSEAEFCPLGVRFEFSNDMQSDGGDQFCRFMLDLDLNIDNTFPHLSYSFCLEKGDASTVLTVSPRSVFGKGVLETVGIILKRDQSQAISGENLVKRNRLFKKIKELK